MIERMDCKQTQLLLAAHIQGALSGAARQSVDGHLAECADCREGRESLSRTLLAVASIRCDAEPSAAVLQKLREAARAGEAPRRGAPPQTLVWRYAAAAAVFFTVALAGFYFFHYPARQPGAPNDIVAEKQTINRGAVAKSSVKNQIEPTQVKNHTVSPLPQTAPLVADGGQRYVLRLAARKHATTKYTTASKDTNDLIAMTGIKDETESIREKLDAVSLPQQSVDVSYSSSEGWDAIDSGIGDIKDQLEGIKEKVESI